MGIKDFGLFGKRFLCTSGTVKKAKSDKQNHDPSQGESHESPFISDVITVKLEPGTQGEMSISVDAGENGVTNQRKKQDSGDDD